MLFYTELSAIYDDINVLRLMHGVLIDCNLFRSANFWPTLYIGYVILAMMPLTSFIS